MSLLSKEIQQRRPFVSKHEETFLNLQRTAAMHTQALAGLLKGYDVTPTQYNALRILRGAHPAAIGCRQIGDRMVTPVPDVTRLVDRLQSRGLVKRSRSAEDRRVVAVSITAKGRRLLSRLDKPIERWMRKQLGDLSTRELSALTRLLERCRVGSPGE